MSLKCLKRYKKPLALTSVAIFASFLSLKYYLERQRTVKEQLDNSTILSRKNHHYLSNQQTADNRVYTISEELKKKLDKIANVSSLLQQLREGSEDKLVLWENLTILCFSRIITTAYLLSALAVLTRVQLNIIGGFMFVDALYRESQTNNNEPTCNIDQIQYEYLQCSNYIVENGVDKFFEAVFKPVKDVLNKYSLKQVLDFTQLDQIFAEINTLILTSPNNELAEGQTKQLGAHLFEFFLPTTLLSDDQKLSLLFEHTRDIMDSHDFSEVLSVCTNTGFVHISRWTVAYLSASNNNNSLSLKSVQLAKLIPVITKCCEDLYLGGVNSFLFEILTKKEVSKLSQNIYEAFSVKSQQ